MEVYPLVNIPNNWALNVWIAAGQPLPGRIARNKSIWYSESFLSLQPTMGNFANYSICRRWATSPKTMFLMHSQISIFSSGPIVSSEQTNLPKDRLRPGNVNTGAGQTQRKLLDRVASMPTSACVECNSNLSTNPTQRKKGHDASPMGILANLRFFAWSATTLDPASRNLHTASFCMISTADSKHWPKRD